MGEKTKGHARGVAKIWEDARECTKCHSRRMHRIQKRGEMGRVQKGKQEHSADQGECARGYMRDADLGEHTKV